MTTAEFPCRFVVQPGPDGGTWVVWDTVLHALRSTGQTRVRAEQVAADLEVQYDTWGLRPATSIRTVQPAIDVDTAIWQPAGRLDGWVRDRADQSALAPRLGWYGRVRTDDGRYLWIPAMNLRRTPVAE